MVDSDKHSSLFRTPIMTKNVIQLCNQVKMLQTFFFFVTNTAGTLDKIFILGKLLKPNLMFEGKAIGHIHNILYFMLLTNGPNKLECCITLGCQ